ncbi:Ig-like domain-containing protein [Aureibacter tunicatorum]|uniref:Gliding motility-associated-like protein n=1 Tax=Aureibacter tunicatorum TaxID=866807 RepID=A0AAE4BSF9_9BACT|nr:Ig-like domain-containing protein [Aureibacter tunicatorum]MDR6239711.1 gliding motility-associated-like protein [Aureibacter tunicatorum]BDD04187.1 hypothetical protein AUTU_16700 [Aureibacter tunicatorum]
MDTLLLKYIYKFKFLAFLSIFLLAQTTVVESKAQQADLEVAQYIENYSADKNTFEFVVTLINLGPETSYNFKVKNQITNAYNIKSNITDGGQFNLSTKEWSFNSVMPFEKFTLRLTLEKKSTQDPQDDENYRVTSTIILSPESTEDPNLDNNECDLSPLDDPSKLPLRIEDSEFTFLGIGQTNVVDIFDGSNPKVFQGEEPFLNSDLSAEVNLQMVGDSKNQAVYHFTLDNGTTISFILKYFASEPVITIDNFNLTKDDLEYLADEYVFPYRIRVGVGEWSNTGFLKMKIVSQELIVKETNYVHEVVADETTMTFSLIEPDQNNVIGISPAELISWESFNIDSPHDNLELLTTGGDFGGRIKLTFVNDGTPKTFRYEYSVNNKLGSKYSSVFNVQVRNSASLEKKVFFFKKGKNIREQFLTDEEIVKLGCEGMSASQLETEAVSVPRSSDFPGLIGFSHESQFINISVEKNFITTPDKPMEFVFKVVDFFGRPCSDELTYKINYLDPVKVSEVELDVVVGNQACFNVKDYMILEDKFEGLALDFNSLKVIDDPSFGDALIKANGEICYTANATSSNNDSFVYQITTNEGDVVNGNVKLSISKGPGPVVDLPEGGFIVYQDESLTVDLKNYISDEDDNIDWDSFQVINENDPNRGVLEFNPELDAVFTYTPIVEGNNQDSFQFRIYDDHGSYATGNVQIFIKKGPPPVFKDGKEEKLKDLVVAYGSEHIINLKDYITDGDDNIVWSDTEILEEPVPERGEVSLDDSSPWLIKYNATEQDGTDTFKFRVIDAHGSTLEGTVKLTIYFDKGTPPVARDFVIETNVNKSTDINFQEDNRVTDAESDISWSNFTLLVDPSHGVFSTTEKDPEIFNYMPDLDFVGRDSLKYRVVDEAGNSDMAWCFIDVKPEKDSIPIAHDDYLEIWHDETKFVDVLANDYLPRNIVKNTLRYESTVTLGSVRTVIDDPTFGFLFTPLEGLTEDKETEFIYSWNDKYGLEDRAKVRILIKIKDYNPPNAMDDTVQTPVNEMVIIDVLANDTDKLSGIDSTTLSIVSASMSGGMAKVNNDYQIEYTPAEGFRGEDIIEYEICDFQDNCATAFVYVDVYMDDVYIPEAITPNGDGINDILVIEGLEYFEGHEISIFDQSGILVYNKFNYDNDWGGTRSAQGSSGKVLRQGTYYYVFDFGDGRPPKTGFIYVLP